MADSNEPPTIIPDLNQLEKDDFEDDLFQSTVEVHLLKYILRLRYINN